MENCAKPKMKNRIISRVQDIYLSFHVVSDGIFVPLEEVLTLKKQELEIVALILYLWL